MAFSVYDTRICLCFSTLRGQRVQSFRFSERVECMVFSVYDERICLCLSTLHALSVQNFGLNVWYSVLMIRGSARVAPRCEG
jgi:hypothetical protein